MGRAIKYHLPPTLSGSNAHCAFEAKALLDCALHSQALASRFFNPF